MGRSDYIGEGHADKTLIQQSQEASSRNRLMELKPTSPKTAKARSTVARDGETLGQILRREREHLKLSQRSVAHRTGVMPAYLGKLEGDEIEEPSTEMLASLAALYGIPLRPLLKAIGYTQLAWFVSEVSVQRNTINELASEKLTTDEARELYRSLYLLRGSSPAEVDKLLPIVNQRGHAGNGR